MLEFNSVQKPARSVYNEIKIFIDECRENFVGKYCAVCQNKRTDLLNISHVFVELFNSCKFFLIVDVRLILS